MLRKSRFGLSFEPLLLLNLQLYKSGFTRIPVYETTPSNVIGILYAKDLILVDPQDQVEIRTILSFHGGEVKKVNEDTTLDYVLNEVRIGTFDVFWLTRILMLVDPQDQFVIRTSLFLMRRRRLRILRVIRA